MTGDRLRGLTKLRSLIVLVLLIAAGQQAQTGQMQQVQAPRVQSPIAIDTLPSGTIVVLENLGRLLLLRPGTDRLVPIKDTLGSYAPVDMAAAKLDGQEAIFITMQWSASKGAEQLQVGLMVRYSLAGDELRTWSFGWTPVAGIALDTDAKVAYLGSIMRPEIRKLPVGPGTKEDSQFIANVTGAEVLGPLALDVKGKRLFVADVAQGAIYVVDLTRKKSKRFVTRLGEPAAVTYDPVDQKLYVADASKRCIWVIATATANPTPKVFSKARELREPTGVAMGPGQTVWVADRGANALFMLKGNGEIGRTIGR